MKQYINIPNILSFFRLISPIVIISCFLSGHILTSCIVFIIAAISDYLDGIIARKFDLTSEFGAMLDPVADKVLVASMYIFFMLLGDIHLITSTIVVARDILIVCGVLCLKMCNYQVAIKPTWSSKVNTAVQLIFLLFVYIGRFIPNQVIEILISGLEIGVIISVIVSGYDYYKLAIDIMKSNKQKI